MSLAAPTGHRPISVSCNGCFGAYFWALRQIEQPTAGLGCRRLHLSHVMSILKKKEKKKKYGRLGAAGTNFVQENSALLFFAPPCDRAQMNTSEHPSFTSYW